MEGVNKEIVVKLKIKRILMLDLEIVWEVYERVYMMFMMNDEMKIIGLKKFLLLEKKSIVLVSLLLSKSINIIDIFLLFRKYVWCIDYKIVYFIDIKFKY